MHAMGIDDAYHVERVLASGAGGTTELVTLDGSGPFVRKRIPAKLARRGVWATLVECDSARLPRVEATYEMPNEFVVVCDYVPGENLEQLVAARGHLGKKDALQIVTQLCEAVGALHARGIIHRDISPTNVIVAADGAHLIDLGIARFRVEGATRDTTQLGTYGFASPEQYGFAQTDARSDVYSLGRMLGYLLTGVMPAEGEKYEAALEDDSLVSSDLRAVIQRASAMEPSARYQSAGAFAAALNGEEVAGPEMPVDSVEPPAFETAPQRRGWVKVLLAVMAALAFVAAVAIILAQTFGVGEKDVSSAPPPDEPAVSAPVAEGEPAGGDGEPSGGNAPAADAADLEIVESGWSVDSQGYVHYALGLRSAAAAAGRHDRQRQPRREQSQPFLDFAQRAHPLPGRIVAPAHCRFYCTPNGPVLSTFTHFSETLFPSWSWKRQAACLRPGARRRISPPPVHSRLGRSGQFPLDFAGNSM